MSAWATRDRFALLQARRQRLEALTPGEFARWVHDRRDALLRHHYYGTMNPAYRRHVGKRLPNTSEASWYRLPTVDKHFLGAGAYASRPAHEGRIILTSTSGTTSTAVTIPQTARSARTGLGDNFLRALAHAGATVLDRHWGIEHRLRRGVVTGSQLSMRWLRRCVGEGALVTATHMSLEEHLDSAATFGPQSISSSPGFLARLAIHGRSHEQRLRPRVVLYGGAALDDGARARINECFEPKTIVGFFATTDAGALGVCTRTDGIYETFSETHWIEVVDEDGAPVPEGQVGVLVVTTFDNLAAPLIRYRVGDTVRFHGWERNRLLLSEITRRAEASLGATLLPLHDLAAWTSRLQLVDSSVVAVQLVRRTTSDGIDQPIMRIVAPAMSEVMRLAAIALVNDFPQVVHELDTGELLPVLVEHVLPQVALRGVFKLPPYVDERRASSH